MDKELDNNNNNINNEIKDVVESIIENIGLVKIDDNQDNNENNNNQNNNDECRLNQNNNNKENNDNNSIDNNNNSLISKYEDEDKMIVISNESENSSIKRTVHQQDPIYTVLRQKILFRMIVSSLKRSMNSYKWRTKYFQFQELENIIEYKFFNMIPYRIKMNHPLAITAKSIRLFVRHCKDIYVFRVMYRERREYFVDADLLFAAVDNGSAEIFSVLLQQTYPVKLSFWTQLNTRKVNILQYARSQHKIDIYLLLLRSKLIDDTGNLIQDYGMDYREEAKLFVHSAKTGEAILALLDDGPPELAEEIDDFPVNSIYPNVIVSYCNLKLIKRLYCGRVWQRHNALSHLLVTYKKKDEDLIDTALYIVENSFRNGYDKHTIYDATIKEIYQSYDVAQSNGIPCSLEMMPPRIYICILGLLKQITRRLKNIPDGYIRWIGKFISHSDAGIIPYLLDNWDCEIIICQTLLVGNTKQLDAIFTLRTIQNKPISFKRKWIDNLLPPHYTDAKFEALHKLYPKDMIDNIPNLHFTLACRLSSISFMKLLEQHDPLFSDIIAVDYDNIDLVEEVCNFIISKTKETTIVIGRNKQDVVKQTVFPKLPLRIIVSHCCEYGYIDLLKKIHLHFPSVLKSKNNDHFRLLYIACANTYMELSILYSQPEIFNFIIENQLDELHQTLHLSYIAKIGSVSFYQEVRKNLNELQIDYIERYAIENGSMDLLKEIHKTRKIRLTLLHSISIDSAQYYLSKNRLSTAYKSIVLMFIGISSLEVIDFVINNVDQETYDKILDQLFLNAHKMNLEIFNYAIRIGARLNITPYAKSQIEKCNDYTRRQLLQQYKPKLKMKYKVGRPKKEELKIHH